MNGPLPIACKLTSSFTYCGSEFLVLIVSAHFAAFAAVSPGLGRYLLRPFDFIDSPCVRFLLLLVFTFGQVLTPPIFGRTFFHVSLLLLLVVR